MKKITFFGVLCLCACTKEKPDYTSLTHQGIYEHLTQQYLTADEPDKKEWFNRVQEMRRKMYLPEENPGVLSEAMASLKMTKEGRTYESGYLTRELAKAQDRTAHQRTKADPLPWVERGPGNVIGRIRAVVVDPSDATENTWFAASIGGGVWKTTDAGQSWENKTDMLSTLTTTTIAISQSNPQVIYVGTGMGYGRIVDLSGSGIWKSTDGGETWAQLESTANGELLDAINRIVVSPTDENLVLACSNGHTSHLGPRSTENGNFGADRKSGIFRSTDGGTSWIQVFNPDVAIGTTTDNRVQQIIAHPTDFNILYASVNEVGVIKSTDAGLTWQMVAGNFYDPAAVGVPGVNGYGLEGVSGRSELAIAPSDPNRIYAAVERPQGQSGDLMMSRDGGATWTEVVDTGDDLSWFSSDGTGSRNAAWFDNTITVHPFNENIVFVGGVNLFRFEVDLGASTRVSTPIAWWNDNSFGIDIVHADHHWLVPIKLNSTDQSFTLLNANDGGFGISSDGGNSWSQIGNTRFGTNTLDETPYGMVTTQFYAVDKKPGENRYIGGLQDAHSFVSGVDPGRTDPWRFVHGGDGVECVWNYRDPNLVMASGQNNFLFKSTDGGDTFNTLLGGTTGFGPFLTKIANSKADPDLIMTIDANGVNRSDDFGDTWVNIPITSNWIGYRPFSNIEISLADPRVVWITSRLDSNPADGNTGGIQVSTDGGLTFTNVSFNFPDGTTESSGMATHPADPNTAYFLFSVPNSPKILKTTDSGQTFEDISGFAGATARINDIGFPDVAVFSMLVMPYDDDVIWAGTEIGLFITEDGGQSWSMPDDDLPNVGIFQMSIVDGQVLLATQGRGVWTVDIPELSDYVPPTVPLTPRLLNAAMNPNGEFKVDINLRSAYNATLVMIDGKVALEMAANQAPETTTYTMVPDSEHTVSVQIVSIKGGEEYKSPTKEVLIFPATPQESFITTFELNDPVQSFFGNGFSTIVPTGFDNGALHSTHPYPLSSELVAQLKVPIIVSEDVSTVRYKDIVLVEEGMEEDIDDPGFYDFVVVEGSWDGINWHPISDGYDSQANDVWSEALNSNPQVEGDPSLCRAHFIDLQDRFEPGDIIFLRFRLFSDPGVNAWGWAIDNLIIQDELALSSPHERDLEEPAISVYPNPTSERLQVDYRLSRSSNLTIRIMDMGGRAHYQNEIGWQSAGDNSLTLDVDYWPAGAYLINLESADITESLRFIKQ